MSDRALAAGVPVSDLPEGFESAGRWGGTLVVRTGAMEILPLDGPSLRDSFLHMPGLRSFVGRGTVLSVPEIGAGVDGPRVVLRHMHRGGLLGPLLTDLYLAVPGRPLRPVQELIASEKARTLGIPTPEILAIFVQPVLGPLHRADVITREVPRAQDLAGFLGQNTDAARRKIALEAVARLLALAHRTGLVHADLNARNVLVATAPPATASATAPSPAPAPGPAVGHAFAVGHQARDGAWLLDLDKARFEPVAPLSAEHCRRQLRRLARSMRKIARFLGHSIIERSEAEHFLNIYVEALDPGPRGAGPSVTDGLAAEFSARAGGGAWR